MKDSRDIEGQIRQVKNTRIYEGFWRYEGTNIVSGERASLHNVKKTNDTLGN